MNDAGTYIAAAGLMIMIGGLIYRTGQMSQQLTDLVKREESANARALGRIADAIEHAAGMFGIGRLSHAHDKGESNHGP